MATKRTLASRKKSDNDADEHPAKWMQGAVKHPGALTATARKAGMSPMAYARKHYHDSGKTGQRARFAVNAQKRRKG
jgi:hypothetical protein